MAEDECSSMKPRRTKKRKGIPVPSFASSDEPANEKKESSLSTSRADKKAKPPPHKSVAVATKQKDKQKHDEEQEQQQQQQEQSLTRQRPRTSRIAMSLCFQRDRQRLDPSLPQYYTRKERRIMNDETPERAGDEEVEDYFYPVALENTKSQAQATLEEKAAAAIFSDDPSSPKTSSSTAKSLFDRNSIDGSASPWSPLATQKFHETEKHVKAFCPEFPHPEQKKESSEAQTAVATKKLVPRSSLFFSPESDDTKEFTEKRTAILTKKPVPQGSHENSQSQSNGQSSNAVFGKANDTEVSQEKSQSQNSAQAKSVVSSNSEQKVPEAAAKPAVAAPAKAPPPPSFRLYFVQKGRDMYKEILVGPKRNARIRGAVVLDRFDRHKTDDPLQMPTQLVVGSSASPAAISKALGFETVEELRHFMFEHDIQCVTRSWAAKESKEPYQAPRRDLFLPPGVESEIHKDLTPLAPSRPADGSSPGSRKASFDRRGPPRAARASEPQRNVALAKLFKKLSKAYQAAPLDPIDTWRAYTFATASSRLRALSFEIKSDQDICRVKNTKGFGSSSMEIIREFVAKQQEEEDDEVVAEDSDDHITCERLQNVLADPQRQSLKRFMNIWGVGRVKALELVQAGYSSIDEIKNDFDQSCLRVQILRNQYIGLINYDDILEEMDRAEATRIGELVRKAVLDRYPQAEVEIMGSYRRGAESCGDVDILIVHRNYDERVPVGGLGKIVDNLRRQGHVAYHLTQLPGMDTEAFETLPRNVAQRLGQPSILKPKRAKDTCSSYMGVFFSPFHPGKKRRVDIKFYPYRERIFAALYFTGNGYFNRSMRLWARRKFGYTLSDHGLFTDGTKERVMDALSEAAVFRRLKLVWKDVTERDGFDAVVGLDSQRATELEDWSQKDFRREEDHHAWIK